ncbi:MAG: hypothetical protein IMY71_06765 [Bacteroidetes bacterium]|nr:hypothetical protein [Bacteroidota bacterium]
MDKDEIKNTWQGASRSIEHFSKEEIGKLFNQKSRTIMRKFILWFIISIILSIGLLLYLVITSVLRFDDLNFVFVNLLLIILTIFFLTEYLKGYYKLNSIKIANGNLKKMIQQKIRLIKRYLIGTKLSSLIIIPFVILLMISIYVFFEKEDMIKVLVTDDAIWGLIFGGIVAIIIKWWVRKKMRKYFESNLTRLENNLKEIQDLI